MKVTTKAGFVTVGGSISGLVVISTLEIGRMDLCMDMVILPGRMVMFIREIGQKAKCLDMESKLVLMDLVKKVWRQHND